MLALEPLSMVLARWFAETALVASALALMAHLATRLRGPGPAARHLLWLVVLMKLMTPPLVHWPWSRTLGFLAPHRAAEVPTEIAPAALAFGTPHVLGPPGGRSAPLDRDPMSLSTEPESGGGQGRDADGPGRRKEGSMSGWLSPVAWLSPAWLVGSMVVVVAQARRIVRFRATLRHASTAPRWLIAEADRIGRRLSVGVPTIRVVDRLATPLLWCLGRPVLLVPAGLLESLEPGRWGAILAHELAHLRRGDPWVGRLELLASVAWWWNPLYWLARRRIDFEAELACDAWVLWALPDVRIEYAESLVRIATSPIPARPVMPALGVAGPGWTLERRLIMILREHVSRNATPPGLLAAALLAAIAAPSWTFGAPAASPIDPASAAAGPIAPAPSGPSVADDDRDDEAPPPAKDDEDAKGKVEGKAKSSDDAKAGRGARPSDSEEALAPNFERQMETLGEKIAKAIEEKFGPDFQKKMEAMGKDIEAKFGPDFQKKMEALGKDIEAKFGPDSDFGREMKALGERMAKEIGPDLDRKKKALAKAKEKTEAAKAKAETAAKWKGDAARAKADRSPAPAKAKADQKQRARRIEALESRIDELAKELKRIKAQDADDDEEDEG